MLQPNSRINLEKGIKFYEQDILFDNYIYSFTKISYKFYRIDMVCYIIC